VGSRCLPIWSGILGFRGGAGPSYARSLPGGPWRAGACQLAAGPAAPGGVRARGGCGLLPRGRAGPWRAPAAHAEAERDRWAQRKAAHLASLEARKQRRLAAAGKKAL